MHYLAACAIYLNEGPYLQEWIEFHRLAGVEKFFLYNHMSTDGHREILKPYVDDGTVVLKDWPDEPGQPTAYLDCLQKNRDEARWIAFIDLDEFLFSPTLAPLPEILKDYEKWSGVLANWATFGPSGHETRPEGLVIENYQLRASDDYFMNRMVKSIVDPKRAVRVGGGINPHCFDYTDGFAVDELFRARQTPPLGKTETVSFSRLRVNHYYMKSRAEWLAKLEIPSPQNGKPRRAKPPMFDRLAPVMSEVRDDVITAYAPALQTALAQRQREETTSSR
jgi:Glycosyltransferase family 92